MSSAVTWRTPNSGVVVEVLLRCVPFDVGLLGVDTSETSTGVSHPERSRGFRTRRPAATVFYEWGVQASTYATRTLEDRTVRIVVDE